MRNKNMTILLVIFLGIMVIGITTLLIFLLLGKGNSIFTFNTQSSLLLDKKYDTNINSIYIESTSSDITIKEAEDNQIHVLVYGSQKEVVESKIENQTLTIAKKGNYFCFGFCIYKGKIIVHVPKEMKADLDIKTVSGDIEIISNIVGNVDLKTTSGDIKAREVMDAKIKSTSGEIILEQMNKGEIITTSGDIKINAIEHSINAESISGDIILSSLKVEEDANLKTTSGDVRINEITDAYIEASTLSGDIHIRDNNRYANHTVTIKTTSGDIKVK